EPEPEPEPPAPPPAPEPVPQPEPGPEPAPAPAAEPASRPAQEPEAEPAAQAPPVAPAEAEATDEPAQEGDPQATDVEGSEEPAPSPTTFATRFGLGSTKSLENVPPEEELDTLVIELAVDSSGQVLGYTIVNSSGRPDVDLEMAGLMLRWQFAPFERGYVETWRVSFTHTVVDGVTRPTPLPEFVGRR